MSTMNDPSLGHLEPVDLRTIWASEPADFTPWLAKAENLKILGDTLGLELELDAVEKEVGSFWADIVCRDIGTDSLVLVENQLEQTDHEHLGKLLTYSAGLQAVTVIWLAARFRDEHRAALDWLNEITRQDSRFFGLEIELWRIGDSLAAPKFDIVSMPNDWAQSVAQSARTTDVAKWSERSILRREYWTGLHERLNAVGGAVHGNRTPGRRSWMSYSVGRSGFFIDAVINMRDKFIRVELYIKGEDAEDYLDSLMQKKDEIERELGYELEWGDQKAAASHDRRISHYLHNTDPRNKSDWPHQHEWLVEHLNKMHRAFAQRVRDL